MADPLQLLCEYAKGKVVAKEIIHNDEKYIAFGDYAYPKDTPTQLLVYGKENEHYSIESIMFLWDRMQLTHTAYVKEAAGCGIRAVTRPDRRDILDYLNGRRAQLPKNSDSRIPSSAPIPVSRLLPEPTEPESKKARLDPAIDIKKAKTVLEQTELRALNENLTADKIAALKKKRLTHQKKNIAVVIDEEGDPAAEGTVAAVFDREWKSRERVWRTRENCLDAATKDFTPLLEMLKSLKAREDKEKQQKAMSQYLPPSKPNAPPPKPRPQTGYSRYDQEIFNKEMNSDFQIDGDLSFVGTNLQNLNKGIPIERKPSIAPAKAPAPATAPTYGRPAAPSSSTRPTSSSPDMPRRRTNRTPIIIIPSAGTSLITMYNAQDILQEMRFLSSDAKKNDGAKRENEVQVHRKRGDRGDVTVPYRVIDNVFKLNDEEWDRVVAVFVMGPAWQFKGWRWSGNPVEIFSHIPAFHLHYDDMKVDSNVARWNVTLLPISRHKRHLDKARLAKFWDTLDRHIVKNKNYLRH
ncbi:unnamed protein product [Auanema sp. JU1783]|nr:unnamed protein product [Auanema sp. JU1783]